MIQSQKEHFAELAARLGSINTFDRRGEVIFFDDFEDAPLKWITEGVGTGWAIARDNTHVFRKGYSVALTTGDTVAGSCQMKHYFQPPVLGKVGMSIMFTCTSGINIFSFGFYYYDGTNKVQFATRVDLVNNKIEIQDDTGSYVEIASGLGIYNSTNLFYHYKVVIDLATYKYHRIIFGRNEYDVSAYTAYSEANATNPIVELYLGTLTTSDSNLTNYVDDFILTQNEP